MPTCYATNDLCSLMANIVAISLQEVRARDSMEEDEHPDDYDSEDTSKNSQTAVMVLQERKGDKSGWRTLAIRWGLFFVAMAVWNEFLWRYFAPGLEEPLRLLGATVAPAGSYELFGLTFGARDGEDVWANWKLGNMVITFIFGAANVPYTLKHLREPVEA